MSEELLREDERWNGKGTELPLCALLRQRLIEEREKNAKLEKELEKLGNVVLGEG